MFEFIAQAMGGNAMEDFLASVNVLTDRMTEIRDELRVANDLLARVVAEQYGIRTGYIADVESIKLAARLAIREGTHDEPPLDAGYKHPFVDAQLGDMTLGDERPPFPRDKGFA